MEIQVYIIGGYGPHKGNVLSGDFLLSTCSNHIRIVIDVTNTVTDTGRVGSVHEVYSIRYEYRNTIFSADAN